MSPSRDAVGIVTEIAPNNVDAGSKLYGTSGNNGSSIVNSIKNAYSSAVSFEHAEYRETSIPVSERVLWKSEQKVKVISIGCGFSGLTMAHKFQHKYNMDDRIEHVIYEKNSDVGGTWFEVSSTSLALPTCFKLTVSPRIAIQA
jgi:acetylornithine/succinyldiaminopimelate/putrescine aminotransferase